MKDWNFSAPPNLAVIVNRKIIWGGDWIAHVFHDADDGGWQFHNNEPGPLSESDAAVVGLSEIVNLDSSVSELTDLPSGWQAWRKSPSSPWQRAKTE
jgi:hypothetical protein